VALAIGDFELDQNAFFFTLSLTWGIEIQQFNPFEKGSEAAFSLSSTYCDFGGPAWEGSERVSSRAEDEDEEAPERLTLAWDEVEESLPAELKFINEEVRAGNRNLDLKSVMEGIPRYQGLPVRPPENTHRGDAKNDGLQGSMT
jgi:hypothetical protein